MNARRQGKSRSASPYLVIGIGGGACKAIREMMDEELPGAKFSCIDADAEELGVLAPVLGARAIHWQREHAPAQLEPLAHDLLADMDLLVIVASLGGRTGSRLAPELARIAREMGVCTAGVFTLPLDLEGSKRRKVADDSLWALCKLVQVRAVIPAESLLAGDEFDDVTVEELFCIADNVMAHAVADIAARRHKLWSRFSA